MTLVYNLGIFFGNGNVFIQLGITRRKNLIGQNSIQSCLNQRNIKENQECWAWTMKMNKIVRCHL